MLPVPALTSLPTNINIWNLSWIYQNASPYLPIRVHYWKSIFLFLNQNICCRYLKEPSQRYGSFEHPKYISELMTKKIITFLRSKSCLTGLMYHIYIWASSQENLSSGVCEQLRCRPACASAQTDQRLYYSLTGKYHILPCYERNITIIAILCTWGDWFESSFFWKPQRQVFSRCGPY